MSEHREPRISTRRERGPSAPAPEAPRAGEMSERVVSVLMSIYNRAEYLEDAVRSVLADTSATHELLLVDDGSTDGAGAIAASFAERAVVLRQDHRGCPSAWNLGLAHARGDFVTFCDSDDLWIPGHTGALLEVLDARPEVDAVFGVTTEFVSPELDAESLATRAPYDAQRAPVGGAMLARRAVFDTVGAFDEALLQGYWFDWYARLVDAGVSTTEIDVVVLRRRIHLQNSSIVQSGLLGEYARALHSSLVRRRASQ
jgi:glycosyltransferase involved in cell wall biosynthesis